jgi:type II secretory pathway pseudopilin PulG
MGQQQLLLIILGVIIVGIAVAVGINMFTASAAAANRDAVASDLQNLAAMAQQHYRRPTALGGGNQSFDGSGIDGTAGNADDGSNWTIPSQLASNMNGNYNATTAWDSVVIVGVGTEIGDNGTSAVSVRTVVRPTTIVSTKLN